MAIEILHGYLIKTISYAENDIIAHLFTKERGLINVFVKSFKMSKKRFQGAMDRYLYDEFEIDFKGEEKLSILKSAKIINAKMNLRSNPVNLIFAEHITELFLNLLSMNSDEFKEYDKILNYIEINNKLGYVNLLVLRFNILKIAGIMPILKSLNDFLYSSSRFTFDSIYGDILLSKNQLEFLLKYQESNPDLFSYEFNDEEKKSFGKFFASLYYSISKKRLYSIELLKEFI